MSYKKPGDICSCGGVIGIIGDCYRCLKCERLPERKDPFEDK